MGSPAVLLFASSAVSIPFGSGCSLIAGADLFVAPLPSTNAGGFTELSAPVPPGSGLFGLTLTAQGLVLDPVGAGLGLVSVTNELQITFGD